MGHIVPGVSCQRGELSMEGVVHGTKCLWGEMSPGEF
jgi:hypothetical protein